MLIETKVKIELSIIRLDFLLDRLKQALYIVHSECRLAQDAHDFKHWPANLEVMLNDGNEAISDDGHMYLNTDSIIGFSQKTLDLEILLNPFEEQLNLPPVSVEQGNVFCAEEEIVRIVDEAPMKFWRIVDNSSEGTGIFLLIFYPREANSLIFEYIVCSVENTLAIDNLVCRLALLPDDKESSERIDSIEPDEVKVASVKHIACQRLVCEPVHRVDIMHVGIGDSVEHSNLRDDTNPSMDPDARLRAPELCPSEYRHAEVNSRRVNGIEPSMQLELLRDAFGLGNSHHVESELLKDTMVSEGIGLGHYLSVDRLVTKTEMLGLLTMCDCDICEFPQTPTPNELTEHQNQQMVPVRHRPTLSSVVVLGEYPPELPLREKLYYLCKNEFPCMHICSNLESDAKVSISKPGQRIIGVNRYA